MNPYTFMNPVGLAACAGSLPVDQGYGYLGDDSALGLVAAVDPEPISASAISIVGTIENFLHLGAGRKEANLITPVQNRIQAEILAPISAILNSPVAGQVSCQQWQQLLTAASNTESGWLRFLHNTQWSDPRAPAQAEATLSPYFDGPNGMIAQLQARTLSCSSSIIGSGVPGLPQISDPGIPGSPLPPVNLNQPSILSMGASSLLPVAIGIGALFLFMRKKA